MAEEMLQLHLIWESTAYWNLTSLQAELWLSMGNFNLFGSSFFGQYFMKTVANIFKLTFEVCIPNLG